MNKEELGKSVGRVLYFDPNNVKIKSNTGDNLSAIFKGVEIMKDPEDYSIAVDLEVINNSRNNVTTNDNKMVYNLITPKEKSNFLKGSKLGKQNVLTDFFTDIIYQGEDTKIQNEGMCINSIDIEFTSWYVASVIIKFTDVRGSSLFSPTEENYTSNINKYTSEGNLFSSFFTMPYPMFKLKIKGYYGNTVTYPLHCSDFKAEFNSETGNFDITTHFIGYTYAILNDIQMTYLMSAPYSEEYGKEYWDQQIKNGRFKTLEGNPLVKLPELLSKIKKGEFAVSNLTASDPTVKEAELTKKKNSDVLILRGKIKDYISSLKNNYIVEGTEQKGFIIKVNPKTDNKIITKSMENDMLVGPKILDCYQFVNQFINTYSDDITFINYKGDLAKEYFQVKIKNNQKTYGTLNLSEILNKIDVIVNNNTNQMKDLGNEAASTVNNTLTEIYQMVPSIYNFTKILLAHMETFLHCIAACANNISKNEDRGTAGANEKTDFIDNKLSPFPWLTVSDGDKYVDTWLGKYHPDFSEVKLVKSFIKAKNEITSELERLDKELPNSDIARSETTVTVGDIWYPINAYDNSINIFGNKNHKPYSNLIKENGASVNELKALLSTRISIMAGLSADLKFNKYQYDSYIFGESKNIIEELGKTTEHLTYTITALNSIKEGKKNDEFSLLRTYNYNNEDNLKYEYNILNVNGIIPLSDDSISSLKKVITGGKVNGNLKYYRNIIEDGIDSRYGNKYPASNTNIIDGIENCDIIYNDWYNKIKNNYNIDSEKDLQPALTRYFLDKKNSSNSFIKNDSYSIQPMLNRVGYLKPESNYGNINTITDMEVYCGYRLFDKVKRDFEISDTKKEIKSSIFSPNNKNFKNLYKLYSGKDNKTEAELYSIGSLDRWSIYSQGSTDFNNLSYPLIGGIFEFKKDKTVNGFWDKVVNTFTSSEEEVSSITSLFGNMIYYSQNDFMNSLSGAQLKDGIKKARRAKAFLFLQTLPIKVTSLDNIIHKNLVDNYNRSFMLRMSKMEALLLGSMLWRRKYDVKNYPANYNTKNNGDSSVINGGHSVRIPDTYRYFRINNMFTLSYKNNTEFDECKILHEIEQGSPMENEFIKLFENWTDDNINSDGWYKIQNNFELMYKAGKHIDNLSFITFLKDFSNRGSVDYLKAHLTPSAVNNYSVIEPINSYTLGMINRDNSPGVKAILSLYFNECIIAYTGDMRLFPTKINGVAVNKTTLTKNNVDRVNYIIDNLISRLKKELNNINNISEKLPDQTTDSSNSFAAIDNHDIDLEVYKYLKTIYDKWVSGYEFNTNNSSYKWIDTEESTVNGLKTYDMSIFKFIDRSYNNIGNKFIIDYKYTFDNLVGLTEAKTLYSTITDVLQKNQFLFIPMPNYQSWKTVEDFAKIFQPIPYNESDMIADEENKDFNSTFICIYTGVPSKRLNISNEQYEYVDDALNLNIDVNENIPSDFKSVSENNINDNMTNVPAFAVSYGKQNQSYFKSLTLNQNNPVTTEASVNALRNLIDKSDKNSVMSSPGQDMYNMYSNYSYTCQVEMLGCPQIQPMMYFQLTNIPMWNGAYLIYTVKHNIRPGHMTTNFTGMRMAETYPNLITPSIISADDLNTASSGIYPKNNRINQLSLSTKMGRHFTLGQYTVKESIIPEYIVSRIEYNLAPTIDSIYDSWMASDDGKKYGSFIITSGYRSHRTESEIKRGITTNQHKQGLAVDIQLTNIRKFGSEANTALFEHIKQKMKNGLKMDQLIKEPGGGIGGLCHVSPAWTDDFNVKIRGQAFEEDSNGHTIKGTFEIIESAAGVNKIKSSLNINNRFLEYWKEAENSKGNPKGGWNKDLQLWFAVPSVEGGAPTISYGIKLIAGSLKSTTMSNMNISRLQAGYPNGLGISDDVAIDEIITRSNIALSDISKYIDKKYGTGTFNNMDEKYRYALVDLYLNTGSSGYKKWVKFIASAVRNDLPGMLANADRVSVKRTNLFKKFLQS